MTLKNLMIVSSHKYLNSPYNKLYDNSNYKGRNTMLAFEKLNRINGFDFKNPDNAKQNSYAWSMTELGDYIYVGTARNMFSSMSQLYGQSNIPSSLISGTDNNAEIWRYKKDGTRPWQRVFKAAPDDQIYGIRAMITHQSSTRCAIYAASIGKQVSVFKSEDGLHWLKLDTSKLTGSSSRSLASFNGKLYIATLDEGIGGDTAYLYSSVDPEYQPFEPVIETDSPYFNACQNPVGGIDNLQVFNHRLYVSVETENGAEVWRSNTLNPKTNGWTLVADKGFGDKANRNIMSSGVFKDHLYLAVTKELPLSLFAPLGFDLIRIDQDDRWELVVGGRPLMPTHPETGTRHKSLSGFDSGFNNFFNVYGWQIQSFKGHLILTTYDGSVNLKTIYNTYRYNEANIVERIGRENYYNLMNSYSKIVSLLSKYKYPKGFDVYLSKDGCHFQPAVLSGLNDAYNYGGRTLHVSCENELYLGTANPYRGCSVYKADFINHHSPHEKDKYENYFRMLAKLNRELQIIYPTLTESLQMMFMTQNSMSEDSH